MAALNLSLNVVGRPQAQFQCDQASEVASLYSAPEPGWLADLSFVAARLPQDDVASGMAPTLNVWLQITNACSLRCTYCFVPPAAESMAPPVGKQAIDMAMNTALKHGFGRVKLKYAGGEPTLRFDLVETLHDYACQEASVKGLELEGVVLSNGVAIDQAMLGAIKEKGLHLAISLDGAGAAHDKQRPSANGHPSVRSTLSAIDRAVAQGVQLSVTVTLTNENLDSLPQTVTWLSERGIPFVLNFCCHPDTPGAGETLLLDPDRLSAAIRFAFTGLWKSAIKSQWQGCLLDHVDLSSAHRHPCAAGHNYLIVDERGRVAQCPMTQHKPITDIWAADPLAEVFAASKGTLGLSVEDKEGCRDCELRYWCAGGCPLQTHRVTGRYDTRSPYCAVYHSLIPDLIRLEGLRMTLQARGSTT